MAVRIEKVSIGDFQIASVAGASRSQGQGAIRTLKQYDMGKMMDFLLHALLR